MRFTAAISALALATAATAAMPAEDVVTNVDKITQLSSDNNDIAKTISVTNFFSTAPQVVNGFKDIVTTVTQDIAAMKKDSNSKRALQRRIDCLNLNDVEKCLEDLGDVAGDPSEILGDKKKRQDADALEEDAGEIVEDPSELLGDKKKRQAAGYTDTEQQAICNSFRGFVQVHQELLSTVIGKHGLLSLTPFTQPIAAVLRSLEGVVDTIAFDIIDSVPTCAEDATMQKKSLDEKLDEAETKYSD